MLAIYTSLFYHFLNKAVDGNKKRAAALQATAEEQMQMSLHYADQSKINAAEAAKAEKQAKALSKLL